MIGTQEWLGAAGLALVVGGVAAWSVPAAAVLLGGVLIAMAWLMPAPSPAPASAPSKKPDEK